MLAQVSTATIIGVDAVPVRVEVDVAFGLPGLTIVGLAGGAVLEARERVRSAIRNSGFEVPARRITVNLAPADLPKEGTAYDLAIAVGILAASGQLPRAASLAGMALIGELALDGGLRRVPGVLALVDAARWAGLGEALVAAEAAAEAAVVRGIQVVGAATLGEVIGHLSATARLATATAAPIPEARPADAPDLAAVIGQSVARRALEIAVAGRHHCFLEGPPGTGKTLLLRAARGLLPQLDDDEAGEVSRIYSVAGLLDRRAPVRRERPVREPHHTVSPQALVGGGPRVRPGEASLAHHGLLVLDEVRHFRPDALDALRQPLESGSVSIARVDGAVTLPARFQLLAAANACPCGWRGSERHACTCDEAAARRYATRFSGPLRDRIDLWVRMEEPARVARETDGREPTHAVAARIGAARARQVDRQGCLNADVPPQDLLTDAWLGSAGARTLVREGQRLALSPRRLHRAARVARTIADLERAERVGRGHVMEALFYRPEAGR
ncbi:MAG: YifB family Mg chelatase-like AAA ATPase [Chloroflexota bacterium]